MPPTKPVATSTATVTTSTAAVLRLLLFCSITFWSCIRPVSSSTFLAYNIGNSYPQSLHQPITLKSKTRAAEQNQHFSTFTKVFPSKRKINKKRTIMAMFVEEKKDDDGVVVYWEAGMNSNVKLPSFKTRPRMIVFDKDGTLGDDAASLKRWIHHMTTCFVKALHEELSLRKQRQIKIIQPGATLPAKRWQDSKENKEKEEEESEAAIISQSVQALHKALGWDASAGHVIPSAPLAAGTWEGSIKICSEVFGSCGLPRSDVLAREWHDELKNLHGSDPPVIPNLDEMIRSCREDFGLVVAVCTSDNRMPTNNALRNWNITDMIDYSICGDEVPTPKPSASPLRLLCQQTTEGFQTSPPLDSSSNITSQNEKTSISKRTMITPEECIIVGDTTGDTGMARNAGAGFCIGVLTGSGTGDQLIETGANIILPNVGHIPALLKHMMLQFFNGDDEDNHNKE